jgi:cytochrome P450
LPLSIVSNLVGVPEEGRERMLDWAAGNFNAFGPASERTSASMGVFGEMVNYAMTQCVPGKLKPGSWAAMLHDAADNGEISSDEARLMALSYLAPSLDTTIFAISNGIALFAANPDQWDIVREHPNSIPNAINEILRLESPIQGFSRFAIRDHKFDEGTVPANSRIILLFGSANRDERHWVDPERFDVLRERAGEHLAFGYGEHMCIGMNLARMEISALLTALARKVSRFTLNSPERVINSTLRGFAHLNVTVD